MDNVVDISPPPLPPAPAPVAPDAPTAVTVDPVKVQKTLKQLVGLGKGLSRLTEWDGDDKVVALLEPLADMPEFAGFLAFLIEQFKDEPAKAAAVIREKLGF